MVKPRELRSPWQRQIHARRLQSHAAGEVIVAAAAAATRASVASLPSPPATRQPPLPLPHSSPHFRVMPRPEVGRARLGEGHVTWEGTQGYSQAFWFPAAPWLASGLGTFFRRCTAPPSSVTKTKTKQKPTQISVTSSFLTASQEVIDRQPRSNRAPCKLSSQ